MAEFEIENLLRKMMGLKISTIGKANLERSVQKRMKTLSIEDKVAYCKKLKSSPFELKELIEEVVVPETWFFRDREPFKAMVQFLSTRWSPKHPLDPVNILSIPCATGEEPYSLAISLLSAGWPPEKFNIQAVDISHRLIARAKEGIYEENSFRNPHLDYRSSYFQQKQKSFIINNNVRDKVHFRTGNILNNCFMGELGLFDVIFFRNVLIYFNWPARNQAIATLYKILADDGILFVGHAEANLFNNSPFAPALYPQAFAFHKKPKLQLKVEGRTARNFRPKLGYQKSPGNPISRPQVKEASGQYDLDLARTLADKGELQKASAICEGYLAQYGPSYQAYFLLGIIRDAADDTKEAERLFRKALYLNPKHEETLIFLSLLIEKTGDTTEARSLKKRLERLLSNKN